MPRTVPRTRVLWGVVLIGLLLSVLGAQHCARSFASAAPGAAEISASRQAAPAVPGCDPQRQHAPDDRQGLPHRGTAAHELLAPLAHEHGRGAAALLDALAPRTPAGRAPPPADAPSPVELSVLRV
ncbi:hypothetical protein ACFW9D_10825 [Streptomyces sp. NPDC059524]|uniref:hypothetical protein n=1 Tax=Streptomyces sp. NPDC059524 TaxID=3346856 RepID=UPI00368ADD7E